MMLSLLSETSLVILMEVVLYSTVSCVVLRTLYSLPPRRGTAIPDGIVVLHDLSHGIRRMHLRCASAAEEYRRQVTYP